MTDRYRVLESTRLKELTKAIDSILDRGWKLAGGVSVAVTNGNDRVYCQAIFK